jgi:protein pelota
MKILGIDKSTGELRLIPENTEDLWHIERVLGEGDLVKARSFRRFKLQEGDSGEKKAINVEIETKKVEFNKYANILRVTGVIKAGTPEEFVQIGSHHTVDIEPSRPFSIVKEWKNYQLDRLRKAQQETKRPKLGILVMDERKAVFAILRGYGIDFTSEISAFTSKKDDKHEEKERQFFGDVASVLANMGVERIIVAGPGFAKENLKKFLSQKDPALLKKISFEQASYAEKSGVYELMKNGVVERIVGEQRVEKEFRLMEKLLAEIGKNSGLAAYGKKEVGQGIEYKAVGELFVLDELLRTDKEIEHLLELAEKQNCSITIFAAENDSGKQLQGLGGIAAILRFRIA